MALWRGWLPSVIGVVPYVGLNFGVYETAKDVIIKMYGAYRTAPYRTVCTALHCCAATSCASRHQQALQLMCCTRRAAQSSVRALQFQCLVCPSAQLCGLPRCACCCASGLRDERDLSIAVRLGCGALAGTMGQVRCGVVLATYKCARCYAPGMGSTAPLEPLLLATNLPSHS